MLEHVVPVHCPFLLISRITLVIDVCTVSNDECDAW